MAAFGDIVAVVFFVGVVDPLVDNREGVKLGESTLNRFLLPLLEKQVSPLANYLYKFWFQDSTRVII